MKRLIISALLVLANCLCAQNLKELPQTAIAKSQLAQPGSKPFYLKATTEEATNPKNEYYKAEIQEWWAAPDRYKRVIRSQSFTETLVVNSDQRSETAVGYYPIWLRTFVDAIFDPASRLQGVDLTRSSDNPEFGTTRTCRRFDQRVGIAPVSNRVFSSYCFEKGLLADIMQPGFDAEYLDYKNFGTLKVARKISEYIQPGETAEAKIVELREVQDDPSMFKVEQSTPLLRTVNVSEEVLRKLAPDSQEIAWPAIREGKKQGVLSLFVGVDREGKVQEVYQLNSDNPHMSDFASDIVKTWQFRRAASNGEPVQVEGILTFAFPSTSASSQ